MKHNLKEVEVKPLVGAPIRGTLIYVGRCLCGYGTMNYFDRAGAVDALGRHLMLESRERK